MMRTQYYTLISSLPAMPPVFETAERAPISELKLQERLKMLEPQDAEVVREISEFLAWDRQPLERTDEEILQHARQFLAVVANPFADELIRYVMSVRTIVAALRRRRLDLDPPIGFDPIAAHIERNWQHPDFRLAGQFPWIGKMNDWLKKGAVMEVERLIMQIAWRRTSRLAEQYTFTFEAVLLYLIRWELVYRWTSRDTQVGRERFEALAANAMGEFTNLFAE